jgi:hypothetical protein
MYISPFGGGGNPYQALEEQVKRQLAELQELGRQAVASMSPQAPQSLPQPLQAITTAIEGVMRPDDLKFLAENIQAVPDFFKSKDGQDILQMVVDGMKKTEVGSVQNDAVAAESRPAT